MMVSIYDFMKNPYYGVIKKKEGFTMPPLFKYSNGWGHLIMSLVGMAIGLVLILVPQTDAATKGIGVTLIMGVFTSWFVPGAAKAALQEVKKEVTSTTQPLPADNRKEG